MVNNIQIVLDCGELKIVPKVYMPKVPDYVNRFEVKLAMAKPVAYAKVHDKYDDYETFTEEQWNEYNWFREDPDSLRSHFLHSTGSITRKDYGCIAKIMGEEPFRPAVMINISPDWKGKFTGKKNSTDKLMIKGFRKVIEDYLNEKLLQQPRYTKWKYCLECGSEGNFLHAHIVAELNPKILESMKSHINRGNHTQQIRKNWKKTEKFKGMEGALKGKYSVQRILLNTEEILEDKLKYLLEENKCDGHKNLVDLKEVHGVF